MEAIEQLWPVLVGGLIVPLIVLVKKTFLAPFAPILSLALNGAVIYALSAWVHPMTTQVMIGYITGAQVLSQMTQATQKSDTVRSITNKRKGIIR